MIAARWRPRELLERGLLVCVLVILTDIRMQGNSQTDAVDSVPSSNPMQRIVLTTIFLAIGWQLVAHGKQTARVLPRGILIWAFLAYAAASILWSVSASDTLRCSVVLTGMTLVGLYMAVRYSVDEQLSLLAWVFAIIMALSTAFALALPTWGKEVYETGELCWRGIYIQKNVFGFRMALAALVMAILFLRGKGRMGAALGLISALALLWLSRSKTSLAALLLVLATIPFLYLLRRHRLLVMAGLCATFCGLILAAAWLFTNQSAVLKLLGKDATLTGRTEIWAAVAKCIAHRPWFGYGLGAFWRDWRAPCAHVWEVVDWEPPHSHNGLLDFWIDFGLVGVLLFGIGFLVALGRALLLARRNKTASGLWPLAYLIFLLYFNVTETLLLRPHSFFWMLYVAAALAPLPRPADTMERVPSIP